MAHRGTSSLCAWVVALGLATGFAGPAPATEGAAASGHAGMGTADLPPAATGEGAPHHLTGEAPRPGDGAGSGAAGHRASDTVPPPAPALRAPDPVPVIADLPPEPAPPVGLDPPARSPQGAKAEAPARDAAQDPAKPEVAAVPEDPEAPLKAAMARLLAAPPVAPGKEQEALAAFYGARSDAPVFVDAGGYTARGKAILARFAAAADEGLEPGAYKSVKLAPGAAPDTLAQAELRLAASVLLYARHAQAGRFDPGRISGMVTPTRTFPDPLAVLTALAAAPDAGRALAGYNPPHPGYAALRQKLAAARSGPPPRPLARIAPGPSLRPGESDPRVPALRARLEVAGAKGDPRYDRDLVAAVRTFQSRNGLEADGIVGAATVEALNLVEDPAERVADLIVNMERWRWLPRDLGAANVMVNIPEYMVRIRQDGRVIHATRVIVGKPETPTPLLTHDMEYVVINPAWNIPPTIARKEMLPKLRADPYFLARQGIEITRNGRVLDPASINWNAGLGGYSFRQPPGERNALGRIKFMFPNDHSVYLHDTPSRNLFANDRRMFSHGCIRVQDPLVFGEVIFSLGLGNDSWTEDRIEQAFGGKERYINLKHHIPVHLVYFTAFVDEAGRLSVRPDIYGIDARTKALLGLSEPQHVASGKPKTATR
ncbi:L,D-transpeptidase family protein [Aquabacter spiritensis]|nr:L,D-transpeptidase family protein [Aquabacter spiritensis]